MRRPSKSALVLLVLLALLAMLIYAIAYPRYVAEKKLNALEVGMPSLKAMPGLGYGSGSHSFAAVLPLTNPSEESMTLSVINYSVLINGTDAGSILLDDLELRAGEKTLLIAPLSTGVSNVLKRSVNASRIMLNLTVVLRVSTKVVLANHAVLGDVSRTMIKQALLSASSIAESSKGRAVPAVTSPSGWVSIPEAGIRVSKSIAWVANGYGLDAVGDGVKAEAVIMVQGLGGSQGKPVSFCVAEDLRVVHDYYANCAEFNDGVPLSAGEVGFVIIPFKAGYSFGLRGYYVAIGKPLSKSLCGDTILSPPPGNVSRVIGAAPHIHARILNPTKYTDCGLGKTYFKQRSEYPPRLKFVNKDSIASISISWLVNGHKVTSVKDGAWVDARVTIKAARAFDDPNALVCVRADLKAVPDKDVACAHLHISLVAGEDYEVIIQFKATNYGHSFLGIGKQRGFFIHLDVGGHSMTQDSSYPPRLKYKG